MTSRFRGELYLLAQSGKQTMPKKKQVTQEAELRKLAAMWDELEVESGIRTKEEQDAEKARAAEHRRKAGLPP